MATAEAPKWTDTFKEGVAGIMGHWKGLQMAVDHQFGGPDSKEKGTWLMDVTAGFMLENDDVDKHELEEYLSVLMNQEFDTVLEDGSTLQVANQICSLFKLCSAQQFDAAKDLIGRITSVVTKKECCHDNQDDNDITKDSAVLQQPDSGDHGNSDDTDKAPVQQTTDHHGDTSKDLQIEQLTLQDHPPVVVTDGNMDNGWEVVKKKKKRKH